MIGLPYGEEIMIVGRTMWTQSTSVTDRQTDGQTDGRTDRITITDTVQRIASHGKNAASLIWTLYNVIQTEEMLLKSPRLCMIYYVDILSHLWLKIKI